MNLMNDIPNAIAALHRGERTVARTTFADLWKRAETAEDPLAKCTIAHYMADAQDSVGDELVWDLRALAAAEELTDERAKAFHESLSVAGFLPSLHLNLASVYQRLGRAPQAKAHLASARAGASALPHTNLGHLTLGAIERLEAELDAEAPPPND
ncbi:hypothetical protein BH09MYX1_BH09MYX1_02950 [soil metagenome]